MKQTLQKIGLRPYEISLIFYAYEARTHIESGNFIVPTRKISAAKRLVSMGYLTEADDVKLRPVFGDWYVIRITQGNIDSINAEIASKGKSDNGC